jgi:ABC-2 type transport system permease protein
MRLVEDAVLYRRLAGAQVRSQMQYRAAFVVDTVGAFASSIVDFLAIWVFFNVTPSLGGWSLAEIGLLYGLSSIAFALADMFASGFDYAYFGPTMVRQGFFDQVLLRPASPFLQVLASQVLLRRIGRLAQGALVLALVTPALGIAWTPGQLAFAGVTVLGGMALFFGLFVLGAAASFWTIESLEAMNVLTYGGQALTTYPMSIFGDWLRGFFTFVVPMAFVTYYPALWLLGRPDPLGGPSWLAFVSAPLCLLACWVCLRAWRLGVNHYQSTGS